MTSTPSPHTLSFDAANGMIEMEAGADWPEVIRATHAAQPGGRRWGIRQKQTGADELTLGGSVSANVHGRGLLMGPFVDDVEALTLVDAGGEVLDCSRTKNAELFALVAGGYGLFGAIATVTLRLGPRLKVARLVDILDVDDAIGRRHRRVAEGCLYGDFQYAIDPADDSFLRRGVGAVLSRCRRDVRSTTPRRTCTQRRLGAAPPARPHRQAGRVRRLRGALPGHARAGVLVGHDAAQHLHPEYDQFVKEARPCRTRTSTSR